MNQPIPAQNNLDSAREQMVNSLIPEGIHDPRVLDAMAHVPREEFVPSQYRDSAYYDGPLPIGHGQTISQPYTVAYMCQEALPQPGDRALEVGTGSGYAAAVLSHLVEHVDTVERIPELAQEAEARLDRLGYRNITVHLANGSLGLPALAPFDLIIVTAGAPKLPLAYADQLAPGGRVVIPIGCDPILQIMCRYTNRDGQMKADYLGDFAFVPLVGEDAWEHEHRRF